MIERVECPEHGCVATLNENEMLAHLEWDHNHDAKYAAECVSRLF